MFPRTSETLVQSELLQQEASKCHNDCLPSCCSEHLKCGHEEKQKASLISIKSLHRNVEMNIYEKLHGKFQALVNCHDKLLQTRDIMYSFMTTEFCAPEAQEAFLISLLEIDCV